ncbi:MAG: hypothetical protein IBX36_01375 [Dehalococcoidia bacterium]|nr:hypothetical protein [Dehalococcoidia bacterium]
MDFVAVMKCRVCGYTEEGRVISNMTEFQAKHATLDCPNCDEPDGLEVESLKPA